MIGCACEGAVSGMNYEYRVLNRNYAVSNIQGGAASSGLNTAQHTITIIRVVVVIAYMVGVCITYTVCPI